MKTVIAAVLAIGTAMGAVQVRLVTSVPSPQPVGTIIALEPRVDNAPPAMYTYRYSVSTANGPFHIIRDFSQEPSFVWAPDLYEHEARIRVTVRNNKTKETADAEAPFQIVARVKDVAVVTPTSHPLVALFSAPACPERAQFRVAFRMQGQEAITHTPPQPCRAMVSNNVYVAGMRADSVYEMRSEVVDGEHVEAGSWMPFHTGLLDGRFPAVATQTPRASGSAPAEGIVIRSLMDPWRPTAVDLDGNVVWYLNPVSNSFLTRVLPGGRFLMLADGDNSANDMKRWQLVRVTDLLGNTLKETNASRIAEQLETHGIKSDCKTGGKECVPGFHHEAILLPNGHLLVIAGLERMFPAGTQGSKEPVDVLGDLVFDLDEDLQLVWFWNSFDHLDVKRASLGHEKCKAGPGDDGCTPVFLAPQANGWLHSNAIDYDARSGDILISIPEQDWVIKVDYKNGQGTGKILWKLGVDGDFTTKSDDPYPWFSYQHDAGFDPVTGLLVLFDDGHRRKDKYPKSNNRGQAWKIDEDAKTATPVLNADVGVYAVAVGSAQPLSDGAYSFESGFMNPGPAGMAAIYSQTTEVSADGKVTWAQRVNALTYRSFRVADMYSAPRK